MSLTEEIRREEQYGCAASVSHQLCQ